MKDTKHVRRDFHYVTLVMPQGWDFGVPRGSIFFSNMVMWHIKFSMGVQTSSPFPSRSAHMVTAKATSIRILFFTKYLKPKFFILKLHTHLFLDFSLTVKAATLIFKSGRDSAIASAKEGKSGFIYNLVKC